MAVPLLPKNPAPMPAGGFPLLFTMLPALIDPALLMVTSAPTDAAIAVAWFTALMAVLPELMTSPPDVVTEILPGPQPAAPMPYGALPVVEVAAFGAVIVTPDPTTTVTLPLP